MTTVTLDVRAVDRAERDAWIDTLERLCNPHGPIYMPSDFVRLSRLLNALIHAEVRT